MPAHIRIIVYDVPAGTPRKHCRNDACKMPGFWIKTPKGSALLIDCDVPGGVRPLSDVPGKGISHFLTCKDPKPFSGRNKKK